MIKEVKVLKYVSMTEFEKMEKNLRVSFNKVKERMHHLEKQLLIFHSRLSNLENKAYDSVALDELLIRDIQRIIEANLMKYDFGRK